MRIACLAWGSLIWKEGTLVLASPWRAGGPALPIEFARVGDSSELATVIWDDAGAPVPTRWALLATNDLGEAREQLRRREGIEVQQPEFVGDVVVVASASGSPADAGTGVPHRETMAAWARTQRVDAVVWTALPPRFDGENGRAPTVDEAVAYLDGLRGDERRHAEHYVSHVPGDIRTPYRAAFEARLGWWPAG